MAIACGTLLLCLSGLVSALELEAKLAWDQRLELGTPVSGVIHKAPVAVGRRVAKGELLLQLDQRLFRTALSKAQARLSSTQAVHEEAQRELERTLELFDRTLLSVHDRQVSEIEATSAESAYKAAQAALSEARVRLEYSSIRAPFDAWVVQLPGRPGETVINRLQAKPLVVVVPAGRMRARAWLSADQLSGIQADAPAQVRIGDETLQGRVQPLALEPRTEDNHYRLDVVFDIPAERLLRPGQAARLQIGQISTGN